MGALLQAYNDAPGSMAHAHGPMHGRGGPGTHIAHQQSMFGLAGFQPDYIADKYPTANAIFDAACAGVLGYGSYVASREILNDWKRRSGTNRV
jgi:hypothetical protein